MSSSLKNKKILITGASSGIGRASALALSAQGAHVILIARREELLIEVANEIRAQGGVAEWFSADLSSLDEVDRVSAEILSRHKEIDVLFNNAGRSIRRPIMDSLERFHDFERCMTINYFAAVRFIRNFVPALTASGDGQIINSSTWGTLLAAGGFGPYNASKIALDMIANTLRLEMHDKGLSVTQIHFPLVHTAMSGATESFKKLPGMSADQAADWVVKAVVKKPREVMDAKTRFARWLYFLFPKLLERISRSSPFSV